MKGPVDLTGLFYGTAGSTLSSEHCRHIGLVALAAVHGGEQGAVHSGDGAGDRAPVAAPPLALLVEAATLVSADRPGCALDALIKGGGAGDRGQIQVAVCDGHGARGIRRV